MEKSLKYIHTPKPPLQGKYYEKSMVEHQIVKLIARSSFTDKDGLQYRYVMTNISEDTNKEGEYIFVWFTKTNIVCQEGDILYISSAQVKGHQEFNRQRQTIIKNVRWESQQ